MGVWDSIKTVQARDQFILFAAALTPVTEFRSKRILLAAGAGESPSQTLAITRLRLDGSLQMILPQGGEDQLVQAHQQDLALALQRRTIAQAEVIRLFSKGSIP